MKTRFPLSAVIVIALSALPLLPGCTQQSAGNTAAYVITSNPPPAPIMTPAPAAPAPAAPAAPTPAEGMLAATAPAVEWGDTHAPMPIPEPLPVSEPVAPPNVRLTTSLNEIIRLTQAGVAETVILTYLTNSPGLFLLGAEEIVYLTDLGISSGVITAMLHRDQTLRAEWGNPQVASAPTNREPVAVAPSYVNSPGAAAPAEAQPIQVNHNYFYDNLSPYGSWVEVEDYGRVWRPTVVVTSPGWQPYRDRGRWIYSDAGWYWMSDYSWGAITFHYGRWFRHHRWGWCWWPDTVWAPSWVTWRYDNSYCGWAPLPPRTYYRYGSGFYYHDRHVGIGFDFGLGIYAYTYVPWSRFHDPRPYYHCLPYARSVAVHRQTTVVNNYGSGNNNTVINRGIPNDRVREHTRTEVRPVAVRAERSPSLRPARLERDGSTLVVNRPDLPPNQPLVSSAPAGERGSSRLTPTTSRVTADISPATRTPRGAPARPERPESTPRATLPRENVTPAPEMPTTLPPARPEARPGTLPANPDVRSRTPNPAPARPPESALPTPARPTSPTPVQSPTPIFSKPVVVQTTPQLPTRPIVTTPPNSTFNGITSRSPGSPTTPTPSPWQNNNNTAPPANRAFQNQGREQNEVRTAVPDRAPRSIATERSSRPEQVAPVTRPAPVATPQPSFTPAPAQPSYSPPSTPAPSAPARPTVTAPSAPPTAVRSEARPPTAASRAESARPAPGNNSESRANSNPRSR